MIGTFFEYDVTSPKGIVKTFENYWWWCVDGDSKRAIVYELNKRHGMSPQCNYNKDCAEAVGNKLKDIYPAGAQLVQIPLAFIPWED